MSLKDILATVKDCKEEFLKYNQAKPNENNFLNKMKSLCDYSISLKRLNKYINIHPAYLTNYSKCIVDYISILNNNGFNIIPFELSKKLFALLNTVKYKCPLFYNKNYPTLILSSLRHGIKHNMLEVTHLFSTLSFDKNNILYCNLYNEFQNNFSSLNIYNNIFKRYNNKNSLKKDKDYKSWICDNHLSLNLFNDLDINKPISFLSEDMITINKPVAVVFKVILEDYKSSRRLFHHGYIDYLNNRNRVIKNVVNTDNVVPNIYSYYIEQMKMAFMMLFSIFNRIAFLLIEDFHLYNSHKNSKENKRGYKLWNAISYKSLSSNDVIRDIFSKKNINNINVFESLYLVSSFLNLKNYTKFKELLQKLENPNSYNMNSIENNDIQITMSRNYLEHNCLNIIPNKYPISQNNRYEILTIREFYTLSLQLMRKCKECIVLCYVVLEKNPNVLKNIYR